MSLFKRIETRAVGLTDPAGWWRDIEYHGSPTNSGKAISARSALQMSAVYFCTSLIADSVSSLPFDVFRAGEGNSKPVATPSWMLRPNPVMTPQDFWHRVLTSMILQGNGYIYVLRDDAGKIIELWPIHPDRVTIVGIPSVGLPDYWIDGTPVDRANLLHIPAFTTPNQWYGMGVVEAAKEAVGLGLTAEEFGTRFFAQGTTMSGVITMPGKLERPEAERLKADFAKGNSGTKNSHAVGVLSGGAQWTNISVTPEQAQFLATRAYTKTDIALFFKVPPFMVDPSVTSTWGSGIEEQNWMFIQNTLQPWITRIEQAVSTFLLFGNQFFRFNLDARMRAKTSERMLAYAKGIENSIYCADDVRAMEDMAPLPDGLGQKFYHPANLVEVGAEPAPVAAPVDPALEVEPEPASEAKDDPAEGNETDEGKT